MSVQYSKCIYFRDYQSDDHERSFNIVFGKNDFDLYIWSFEMSYYDLHKVIVEFSYINLKNAET